MSKPDVKLDLALVRKLKMAFINNSTWDGYAADSEDAERIAALARQLADDIDAKIGRKSKDPTPLVPVHATTTTVLGGNDVISLQAFRERKQLREGDDRLRTEIWNMMLLDGERILHSAPLDASLEIQYRGILALLRGAIDGDARCRKVVLHLYEQEPLE